MIKNHKTTGAFSPSTVFLAKRMINTIDFSTARVLVEFGPGNGVITRQILKKMHKDAILICFEVNDAFYQHISKIKDSRLVLVKQSAANVIDYLATMNYQSADCVISSLPLSVLPKEVTTLILKNAKKVLKPKGFFIQYQYTTSFYKDFKQLFGNKNVFLAFELLNVPPAFIYKCIK